MNPKNTRIAIIIVLVLCSGLIFIIPTEPVLNTGVLFDDKVDERIENEKVSKDIVKIVVWYDNERGYSESLLRRINSV